MQNKRIVVKVGTSTLSHPSGLLNIRRVEELMRGPQRPEKRRDTRSSSVSSGAIGMGVGKLLAARAPGGYADASRPLPPWASVS